MKILFIIFILFLLFASSGYAWGWDTHKYLADVICSDLNCGCYQEIEDGSIYPDKTLNDVAAAHHCYNPSVCTPSVYYDCPTIESCPAITEMQKWFESSQYDAGCRKWFDMGVASHYFFDALDPWHQVQNENYDLCHAPMETQVDEKIKSGVANWNVSVCGITVYSFDFDTYVKEFENYIPQTSTSNYSENISIPSMNDISDIVTEGVDIANKLRNKGATIVDNSLNIAGWRPTAGQFIIGLIVIMAIAGIISFIFHFWKVVFGIIVIIIILVLLLKYMFGIEVPFI